MGMRLVHRQIIPSDQHNGNKALVGTAKQIVAFLESHSAREGDKGLPASHEFAACRLSSAWYT